MGPAVLQVRPLPAPPCLPGAGYLILPWKLLLWEESWLSETPGGLGGWPPYFQGGCPCWEGRPGPCAEAEAVSGHGSVWVVFVKAPATSPQGMT